MDSTAMILVPILLKSDFIGYLESNIANITNNASNKEKTFEETLTA